MIKLYLGIFFLVYIFVLIISYATIIQKQNTPLGEDTKGGWYANTTKATGQRGSKHTTSKREPRVKIDISDANLFRQANPFFMLGAYPEPTEEFSEQMYHRPKYGIHNDDNYCDRVDMANLKNPTNLFKKMSFWTDFPKNQLPSQNVMRKIGHVADYETGWVKFREPSTSKFIRYGLNETINSYFTQYSGLHHFHKMGSHYLCASQMINHIPGAESLTTKDQAVDNINAYIKKYEDAGKPQCFNKKSMFPYTYRLFNKRECKAFFAKINSDEYKESLKEEAIQFLIKVGHGSHKSEGVFLLDEEKTDEINDQYNYGRKCGSIDESLLAQTYIGNPLLLDHNNKFDFRVYMLIASTNPLVVYYHDGFIKNSLYEYEKKSDNRGTHITNTYLANLKIKEAQERGEKIYGMTPEELKKYILWDFNELKDYLLEAGRITDPDWLDNYLRPAFHKAFIHLTRATQHTYWKGSNVYALQGADFMLDDKMKLWFIEANPSPLLSGTTKWRIYLSVVRDHFDVMFAYLRSRMKRAFIVINNMQNEIALGQPVDYSKYRREFAEAMRNRLEPEYQVPADNSWTKIVDENLSGKEAYANYISDECLEVDINPKVEDNE